MQDLLYYALVDERSPSCLILDAIPAEHVQNPTPTTPTFLLMIENPPWPLHDEQWVAVIGGDVRAVALNPETDARYAIALDLEQISPATEEWLDSQFGLVTQRHPMGTLPARTGVPFPRRKAVMA